ncbi:MAG: hypothetical protein ACRDH9_06270 [Actinomycetota bacterium]
MKRSKRALALVTGAIILGLVAEAGAFDFSPTIDFTLGDKKANVNSTLRTVVKQDSGEEELKSVELKVPAGFSLALDQQLTDGETLGAGAITIDVGPRCRGVPAASAPANIPVNIVERNRRQPEIAADVKAVYVVDLRPVTTIDLLVTGSTDKGWTLFGNVPPNADTCPPFTFDATFRARAEDSETPILTNPQFGGDYKFEAKFVGLQGGVSDHEQTVKIEGPSGGGSATQSTGTKSCKGLKGKKKKRCKKRLS